MDNRFFEQPVLNSPYEYPSEHWELASEGQTTQQIIESRRRAEFITPIPKPKKRKGPRTKQMAFVFDEVYQIEADFKEKVASQFHQMIHSISS